MIIIGENIEVADIRVGKLNYFVWNAFDIFVLIFSTVLRGDPTKVLQKKL